MAPFVPICSQMKELNRGAASEWRAMETAWAVAQSQGHKVKVEVKTNWSPNAAFPETVNVYYEVTNKDTGLTKGYMEHFSNTR